MEEQISQAGHGCLAAASVSRAISVLKMNWALAPEGIFESGKNRTPAASQAAEKLDARKLRARWKDKSLRQGAASHAAEKLSLSPEGTAELSPGRRSWVKHERSD